MASYFTMAKRWYSFICTLNRTTSGLIAFDYRFI
jgi:hypothetical protein